MTAKKSSRALLWTRGIVAIAVLAIGIGIGGALMASKTQPSRSDEDYRPPLVEVVTAHLADHALEIEAFGTVAPAQLVQLAPEAGGRVVWQSEQLVPGGRFKVGEPLLRVDPRNYETALSQQQAQLSEAKTQLQVERSRRSVAAKEWAQFATKKSGGSSSLALREPQMRTAKAGARAAKSNLARAKLELQRTELVAPFNAVVQQEQSELGQLVGPQMPVATLVGTDRYWVRVSVPVEKLPWIEIPDAGQGPGSAARVEHRAGDVYVERNGRVTRLFGDLDPVGQMARLLVEVEDPLGLKTARPAGAVPLLLGAYVRVMVQGRTMRGVVQIPRSALREGNQVYVVDDEDRLKVREVAIAWRQEDSVLVRQGIGDGERVIISRVPAAVQDMQLRVAQSQAELGQTVESASQQQAPQDSGSQQDADHAG